MYLVFDTASPISVCACIAKDTVLDCITKKSLLASEHFVSDIETLCTRYGRPKGIVVGMGPGSYTGLRIAAAAALGLRSAWKTPLFSACTLELFMSGNAAALDARSGGLYFQERGKEPKILTLAPPGMQISSPQASALQLRFPSANFIQAEPDPFALFQAALTKGPVETLQALYTETTSKIGFWLCQSS